MKNGPVSRVWQREGVPKLVLALSGTSLFIFFLVLFGDPYINLFIAVPVFIFSSLFFLNYIYVMRPKRAFLLLSASGMIILALVGFTATSWHGSPSSVQGFMTQSNCVPIKVPNETSPFGYVNGTSCTTSSNPYFNTLALAWDLFFWFIVSGLVCFAMPIWERGVTLNKITRNFFGAAVAAALIFLFICVPSEIPSHSLSALLVPIDPYSAFAICDSSTFFSGQCISANAFYLVADYFFWVAVCSLASLSANEFYASLSRRVQRNQEHPPEIPAQ